MKVGIETKTFDSEVRRLLGEYKKNEGYFTKTLETNITTDDKTKSKSRKKTTDRRNMELYS